MAWLQAINRDLDALLAQYDLPVLDLDRSQCAGVVPEGVLVVESGDTAFFVAQFVVNDRPHVLTGACPAPHAEWKLVGLPTYPDLRKLFEEPRKGERFVGMELNNWLWESGFVGEGDAFFGRTRIELSEVTTWSEHNNADRQIDRNSEVFAIDLNHEDPALKGHSELTWQYTLRHELDIRTGDNHSVFGTLRGRSPDEVLKRA